MPTSTPYRKASCILQATMLAGAVALPLPVLGQTFGYSVPYLPSGEMVAQQGFVRIVNQSDKSNEVRITAIDDRGKRHPDIVLSLDPWAAVHFNSQDLKEGNPSKGLLRGVGRGHGDWRLDVHGDEPFIAMGYVRTSDGFVTSVFETAGWWEAGLYWVPFFNPGSNYRQVSLLRLVNPSQTTATVTIHGVDDAGQPGEAAVSLELPPGSARMLSAEDLENGVAGLSGRLAHGKGKWRLWVESDVRLHVLSLLESPTGNITNLSTGAWWGYEGRPLEVPLVLPPSHGDREGFVRIINSSRRTGEVRITAMDDDGMSKGSVTLNLEPFAATHFNSTDLANGNPAKGLQKGIGGFEKPVRLRVEPEADNLFVTALAYVRTDDGFVTSVHDLAPSNGEGLAHVAFLNPGSNWRQQSSLRLINPGGTSNTVEILARDSSGEFAPNGAASLTLQPGASKTLTAKSLEDGGADLSGHLGDGVGKWQLLLQSDEAIQAMSLLETPTGNLTNLSATPATQRLRITDAPTAHNISTTTTLATPYFETQLSGSDPDGDNIWFYVDGGRTGPHYSDAHVEWETGRLLATLAASEGDVVKIPFRATDGYEWSERAYVTITIEEDVEEQRLGANSTDPRDYASLSTFFFDDSLWSEFESGERALPRAIDLSGNFPAPGIQGHQNSCTAWATAYLKSYQERMEEGWEFTRRTTFSPAWIYNQINGGRDDGSRIIDAMRLIQAQGAATLATMPYDDRDYLTQPSTAAIQEAQGFLGGTAKSATSVMLFKAALAHRVPFVVGVQVFPSMKRLSGPNPVYQDLSGVAEGGHAMVVVGYDDDRFGGAFKVLNSWGQGWGDQGFFWIPYDTFRDRRLGAHAFTVEDQPNTGVHRPDPAPEPDLEALPNLVVAHWDVRHNGAEGWLSYQVSNHGTVDAPSNVSVALMLSADPHFNTSDFYVFSEAIPFAMPAASGAHRSEEEGNEAFVTLPEHIPPGDYYAAIWVDDLNRVRETNERDNLSRTDGAVLSIVSDKPDLTPISWYYEYNLAGDVHLEYQVQNIGAGAVSRTDWVLQAILHAAPVIEQGRHWVLFEEQGSFALEPGEYVYRDAGNAAQFNVLDLILAEVPVGTYYTSFVVDATDVVDESNEFNNQSTAREPIDLPERSAPPPKPVAMDQPSAIVSKRSPQIGGALFNGVTPPKALTRRVRIVETADGGRRAQFLDSADLGEGHVVAKSSVHTSAPALAPSDQTQPAYHKRAQSADVYSVPLYENRPLPQQ